ncbi:hypothetical protein [Halomonas sp. WWR20]
MFFQSTIWVLAILVLAALGALSLLLRWRKKKGKFLPRVRFSDDDPRAKEASEWPEYMRQVLLPVAGIALVVAIIYLFYIYRHISQAEI